MPVRQSPLRRLHSQRSQIISLLCGLFVLLALLVVANQALAEQRHTKAVAERTAQLPRYGIAAGGSLDERSDEELDKYFAGLEELGVGWVRFDFDWSKIQPDNANSYNWQTYDRLVSKARAHNLIVLGILDFTPAWARPAGCTAKQCAPKDPASFATFAAAVSDRYQDQGLHYWEIWNEPNTTAFWQPKPNPAAYTKLLQLSARALRHQDSQALIIAGGTAPAASDGSQISPVDFLKGIYKANGQKSFDAIAHHPYTYPVPPSYASDHAWAQMSTTHNNLRAVMKTHNDENKAIWITEYGAPTGGAGPTAQQENLRLKEHPWHVDENLQSYSLAEAIRLHRTYNWAGPMFIYSYQDAGSDPTVNENFFGLVRLDGSHKPAYDTLQQAAQK